MGKHIKNASSKYDDSIRTAERFNEQIRRITGVQAELYGTEEKGIGKEQ